MVKFDTGVSILGWGISIGRTFDRGPDLWFIQFQWQWGKSVGWKRYFAEQLRWRRSARS